MKDKPRVFVAVYHSYVDLSSGAAISLRDMMEALAKEGWEVRVLSGPKLDFEGTKTNQQLLREQGITFATYRAAHSGEDFSLCLFSTGGVDCGVWIPRDAQADPNRRVGEAWLSSYREILDSWRPDVVITYGGFWMTRPMMQLAKRAGARTVFYLCNYAYTDRTFFDEIDVTVVLSRFHAQWCREHIGIDGVPVYPLMPPERYSCQRDPDQRYVTFVNPQPHKGVYVFARIAEVMKQRRPDIPFLVVEGRASVHWLAKTGADLSAANLFRMENTPDPRDYLKATHLLLVPSVWQESFGRVAAEAMMNGIPVIGSNRGSLPEVIGNEELLMEIPQWLTPESRQLPTREEIDGWVKTIERLWNDASYYHSVAGDLREKANTWSPLKILSSFESILLAADF